ncbi:pyridoxal phosphate-dependent aminotransferase [Ligilactobacillus agilis]|uniref:pyridoxal phosphate-dependent aminotransferase n=1 Tax=Ligilactobacillus agilis TaxID=1601 RepID=UPI001F5725D2|nr:pyridoxal phosphate-dependent aminotransferase [Ligilactobacillus agilis]UNL43603.1 pyridoxal phosphate-dependent aminotransferase [Ligilactobacillus agilis]UNL59117.1 pyridoxal phosphate-dependent aminotransferase [Ligilactobacillus agilis]
MKDKFNHKIEKIAVSDIRQFDTEVSSIPGIIKLTLGEPDFNTPEHVKQAGIKAIEDNQSHYTPNPGIMPLREATAAYFNEKYHLNYKPTQVITTIGATEAISVALQTILNPDDVVIMPTPVFPIYKPITEINQGNCIMVDTSADGFILTADKLRQVLAENQAKTVKALVLVYPSNPTGVTYSRKELEELAEVVKEAGIWVLCDEVYAELTYNGQHTSLAEIIPDQVLLVSGLSKSHAMTGWRIGYLFGPEDFVEQAVKAHQYMVTAPTDNVQFAALEAMTNGKEDSQVMKAEYLKRREFLQAELSEAGFEVASPDGAFYLFAKIPAQFEPDSWAFVRRLAKEAKVALIPGISFGPGGEGYVRLSYAASMENLTEAAKRIKAFVAAN